MAFEPSKHVNGRMWPPGVSGNPNGRPVGSRTVFSQSFLKDLASVWAERGRAAMEKTAIDQPGVFFATCARLIGPEVKLTIEQTLPGNLSMEDWQVMREIVAAVRQAIPDAAGAPPGADWKERANRRGVGRSTRRSLLARTFVRTLSTYGVRGAGGPGSGTGAEIIIDGFPNTRIGSQKSLQNVVVEAYRPTPQPSRA